MLTPEEEAELRSLILLDWIKSDRRLFPGVAAILSRKKRRPVVHQRHEGGLGITPSPLPGTADEMARMFLAELNPPKRHQRRAA